MLNFWKRRREARKREQEELAREIEAIARADLQEFRYRMEHDEEYRQSVECTRKFFQADSEANRHKRAESHAVPRADFPVYYVKNT